MSAFIEGRFVGVSQEETDTFVESMKKPSTKRLSEFCPGAVIAVALPAFTYGQN
jgi:hypothetical protein